MPIRSFLILSGSDKTIMSTKLNDSLRWKKAGESLCDFYDETKFVVERETLELLLRDFIEKNSKEISDAYFIARATMILLVYEARKSLGVTSADEVFENIFEEEEILPFSKAMIKGIVEASMGDRVAAEAISGNFYFVGGAFLVPRLSAVVGRPVKDFVSMAVLAAEKNSDNST